MPTESYENLVERATYLHKIFLLRKRKKKDTKDIAKILGLGRMSSNVAKEFADFLKHFFAPFEEYMPLKNKLNDNDCHRIISDLQQFSDVPLKTFEGVYSKKTIKKIKKFKRIF